ncbi:hypothetical protein E3P99_04011 [Wallemia hederae]|uniref:Conserved oligomeric Golgi complex subunit 6 n=1 Tax=Wallemia hederae TaxID=1540922 RepID=A0A4T0FDW9_9BASI|nr:hypothetical protein E3P99_04011 [Wallemia hederae]
MSNEEIINGLNYLDNLKELDSKSSKLNLKAATQSDLLSQSTNYLAELGQYKRAIDTNYESVEAMNTSIQSIHSTLSQSIQQNTQFTHQVSHIKDSISTTQSKLKSVEKFISIFTLPQEQQQIISSKDYIVNYPLLDALTQLNKIRDNAQLLLTPSGDPSVAALDILHSSSLLYESAYGKIFRYLKHQFDIKYAKSLVVDVEPLHVDSLSHLSQRNDLYLETLLHLTKLRRHLLQSHFLTALSQFENNQDIITDPIKYSAELLAWLHQHAADEKELLKDLLQSKPIEEALSSSLQDVSSRIRPKLQLTHALNFTQRSSQLTELISFYQNTLTQSIPVACISDLFTNL